MYIMSEIMAFLSADRELKFEKYPIHDLDTGIFYHLLVFGPIMQTALTLIVPIIAQIVVSNTSVRLRKLVKEGRY